MKTLNKFLSLLVITLMVVPMSLVPSVANAVGPTTIFSDGFEPSTFSNWDSYNSQWHNDASDHYLGAKSARVTDDTGNNLDYLIKSVSTSGYNNISIEFWYRVSEDLGNNDYVEVRWRSNSGDNWIPLVGTKIINETSGNWKKIIANFPLSASDKIGFQFSFAANLRDGGGGDKDEVRIDDVSLTGTPIPENTLSLCSDGLDNDKDGKIDLEDTDCASFMPKLTVTKIVTNDSGGAKQVSDFSLFVDGNSVTSGAQNTFSTGSHTVSETSDPSYAGTIGGDCASNGTITLSVGDVKSCTITNNDLTDVCPNIAGAQATVPEGKQIVEGQCVDIPPQCNTNVSLNVVSDSSTQVDSHNAVPLTFIHPAWTASIPGATWIWATDPVESPTNDVDLTKVFIRSFPISGVPTSGTLLIATDNSYSVKINGNSVPVVFDQDNFKLETQDSYDVSSMLVTGSNTIEITVTNWEAGQDGDPANNPAGLLYKLEVKSNECPPPPTTATIVAQKIVCDSESDLPNWGDGQSTMQQITSNTASRYVNTHPTTCRLAEWNFEWAPTGESNPGDNVPSAGGAWTSFADQTTVPAGARVWVREQVNSDYAPFSGDTNGGDGWDSVSAEMYCHNDVLNYDNYDYIDPVVAGETYYCVGFNVKKEVPAPQTSTVKMCKIDDEQQPLSGWNLMLLGNKYGSVDVNPDGTEYKLTSVPVGNYVLKASGQYTYRPGSIGAEYSDSAYSKRLPSDGVYQTALLDPVQSTYLPWVRENNFPNPNTGWLGIIFNNALTDWGSMFNPSHIYALGVSNPSVGDFSFKILDDVYSDNSGHLTVDVYPGYQGYTGSDGCVTFTNVPYGTYTADEILQDGWSNVSGLSEVVVNDKNETFTIVNQDNSVPPAPACNPGIELIKNGSFENNIVSNPEKWNIFASGITGLEWLVEWFGGSTSYNYSTRPKVANIELHNGVNSWLPFEGNQYAELDTDWFGPSNPLNGEPASVAISQDITTVPGREYKLTYNFSPRPNTADTENILEVLYNGLLDQTVGPTAGISNTSWTSHSFKFTATSTNTRITFRDAGSPDDSLGVFVDNVSMKCVLPNEKPPIVCEEGYTLVNDQCVLDEQEPTDVCPNDDEIQTSTEECTNNNGREDTPPSQPNPPVNPPLANGPVNFGFVAPGNGMVLGASTGGEVLGASCGLYMERYLRLGNKKNDSEQVKKLQEFLNKWMGSNLPITGYYGPLTLAVLKEFQAKYGDDILKPWNLNAPTGLVYLSTLRKINNLECPDIMPDLPELVPWSANLNAQ